MSTIDLNETEKSRVLARIRKMLALSNDAAASNGERDNAMRMVHATLAKYNLSIGDADEKSEERLQSFIEVSPHVWARTICSAIAQLYFCEYFYSHAAGSQRIKHYFVGRESNVITAQEMSAYVVKSVNKEARITTRLNFADGKFERDFCKGASVRIFQRCKDIRAKAEETAATQPAEGTSLVLASLYAQESKANIALMKKENPNLRDVNHRQTNAGASAYGAGKAFGDRINLNNQVCQTKATALLK